MALFKSNATESVQRLAADLLVTPGALVELSQDDAKQVVNYMAPKRIASNTVIISEGEIQDADYMMLVIDGEVTVENSANATANPMVVSILGAGSLIGEMGLLDGGRRSATCIAATDLSVAVLTRSALMRLMEAQPAVAARLLLAMSKRVSDHLRETNRKLMTFVQLSKALQEELDGAHGANRRLLGEIESLKKR